MAVNILKTIRKSKRWSHVFGSVYNDGLLRRSCSIEVLKSIQDQKYSSRTFRQWWILFRKQRKYVNDMSYLYFFYLNSVDFCGICYSLFSLNTKAQTSKLNDAIGENLLDNFTLRPAETSQSADSNKKDTFISGQIKGCNKGYIFMKFTGENFGYISKNCHKELYDIVFHVNRTPFQLQHNALEWMKKHNLFHCLINNPSYDMVLRHPIFQEHFMFR